MHEKLNVVTLTTAGESSFSSGTVERHNLVVSEVMMETNQDLTCLSDVAFTCAASIKNQRGFGQNQLASGHNIIFFWFLQVFLLPLRLHFQRKHKEDMGAMLIP